MTERITWEMVKPEGTVQSESFVVNPYRKTLEAKTILLRWNGKQNGDAFLNRIGELLAEHFRGVKIIKSWEIAGETATSSTSPEVSKKFARKLAGFKPDIVIGSTCD